MSVTKLLMGCIDLKKRKANKQNFFKISSFVFSRRKKFKQG